jgi:hypothetical protein
MSKREILVLLAECENKALILELYDSLACSLRHQLADLRRAVEADVGAEEATHRAILAEAEALTAVRRDPWLKAWAEGLRQSLERAS